MALARFLVLDVCAGVWTCPHAVVGNRDEIASDCSCSASSSSRYHGKWRESHFLLGPSARLLVLSVSVVNSHGEISFSRCSVRPLFPSSPISIGRVFSTRTLHFIKNCTHHVELKWSSSRTLLLLHTRIATHLSSSRIIFASLRPRLVKQSGINDLTKPDLSSITDISISVETRADHSDRPHTHARLRSCTRAHCYAAMLYMSTPTIHNATQGDVCHVKH